MRPQVRLIGCAVAVAATPAAAQRQDSQLWLQVNTVVPIAERARLTLEQIARFSDRQDGLYQTEFGGIIGYRKVGAHNGNAAADEDRLRQHIVMTFGSVTARLRLDERFHPDGDQIGFRFRPLVRYNHRLGRGGLAPFASHESFFLPNGTRWGQRSGYERMRNVVGVALSLSPMVAADIGYLNQYRFARAGARAQMDHALSVQVTINLAAHQHARADD